jgi:hypothetical protein
LTPDLEDRFATCAAPPRFASYFVVCIDAFTDPTGQPTVSGMPQGHVVQPNQSILVMVRHSDRLGVTASVNGTRGLYQPPINNNSGISLQAAAPGAPAPKVQPIMSRVTLHPFAPRLPGNVDIKVTTLAVDPGGAAPKTVADTTVELIVDTTYGGAFRMGFGVVAGGAVDRSYAARKAPQSGQSEIIASNSGKVDIELVFGFAPFVFDYLFYQAGRSYLDDSTARRWLRVAPYVGVGVLSVGATGVDGFKSLYLGGEWEPMPNTSVALTAIGRRVTRLSQGAVLGGPTLDGSVPTTTGFDWGWGVVINVSPDFFRLATQKNASLFK